MDKIVKYSIVAVVGLIGLACVLLVVAGAIVFVLIPLYNDASGPSSTPVVITATPTSIPSPSAQAIGQAPEEEGSTPVHHVSGRAFFDNTHTVLITTDTGNQVWAPTDADGNYQADIQTTGKSFTVSVYDNQGAVLVYTSKWYRFSAGGSDEVNVDSVNM